MTFLSLSVRYLFLISILFCRCSCVTFCLTTCSLCGGYLFIIFILFRWSSRLSIWLMTCSLCCCNLLVIVILFRWCSCVTFCLTTCSLCCCNVLSICILFFLGSCITCWNIRTSEFLSIISLILRIRRLSLRACDFLCRSSMLCLMEFNIFQSINKCGLSITKWFLLFEFTNLQQNL